MDSLEPWEGTGISQRRPPGTNSLGRLFSSRRPNQPLRVWQPCGWFVEDRVINRSWRKPRVTASLLSRTQQQHFPQLETCAFPEELKAPSPKPPPSWKSNFESVKLWLLKRFGASQRQQGRRGRGTMELEKYSVLGQISISPPLCLTPPNTQSPTQPPTPPSIPPPIPFSPVFDVICFYSCVSYLN